MKKASLSIIIPAYNEEQTLDRTLMRLQDIRLNENLIMEIIVALRPSSDRTADIAREFADKVVEGGRLCEGRNSGAEVATGDILVFLDADMLPSVGTLTTIANLENEAVVGSCTAVPNIRGLRARILVAIQNFARSIGLVKGGSLYFVHRSIFLDKGIMFDTECDIGEKHELYVRAKKQASAKFVYLRIPNGTQINMRRYEREGYLKMIWFWTKWFFSDFLFISRVGKQNLERTYYP